MFDTPSQTNQTSPNKHENKTKIEKSVFLSYFLGSPRIRTRVHMNISVQYPKTIAPRWDSNFGTQKFGCELFTTELFVSDR